jgi:hypothetical protein
MQAPLERAGALVVRVWLESSGPEGLRARITYTVDTALPGAEVTAAKSVDEICDKVRTWLEIFLADLPSSAARDA